MPAPLAKGLLISLTLLFAAGVAVYENPHVRQWVDDSRRKVAIALHSLGDELAPSSEERQNAPDDASTREDNSPGAVERRRQARQEILERGRLMEERRRAARQGKGRGASFDDLVDEHGALKRGEEANAITTAAEAQPENGGLRHRTVDSEAAVLGSKLANPFEDETFAHFAPSEDHTDEKEAHSRASTPTLPASPPVPPKPAAYQPQRLLIDTDPASNHASEKTVGLTPTTSASSAAADLAELDQGERKFSPASYWSVDEWAQNHSVHSLQSPPESSRASEMSRGVTPDLEGSLTGSLEHASQVGTDDMDIMSEFGDGINTPGTWTEVGSQVSEE
ncbi:MAG: hypothetical protein Q9163_004034 [Psora crenata]